MVEIRVLLILGRIIGFEAQHAGESTPLLTNSRRKIFNIIKLLGIIQ